MSAGSGAQLEVVLGVVVALATVIGVVFAYVQARASIREGRQAASDRDKALVQQGYDQAVREWQPRYQEMVSDRDYWRGLRGGSPGHD